MPKVKRVEWMTGRGWRFYCPGCECSHVADARWTFNGNVEKPSFTPSFNIVQEEIPEKGIKKYICHSHVIDGKIQFLGECTHGLAGKSVDLEDIIIN